MDLLSIIVLVLILAWVAGAFVVPVGGSLIHLLLVIAIVVIVIRVLRGERL
jgi:hypothetical protein